MLKSLRLLIEAKRIVVAAAVILGLAVAVPSQGLAQAYLLKPGDVVEISVLEDPSLNRQALVAPDGRISVPLAGIIDVGGKSLETVQNLVRARLQREFVQEVTVSAALAAVAADDEELLPEEEDLDTISIYVLGEVGRPGRIDLLADEPVTVLQALSLAGGLGPFAARHRIQIRQTVEEEETVRFFDYDAIEEANGPQPLFKLGDGDVIIAPERGLFD
ncbi:MAG: polysaccharide biosynthesis/export family protein [Pseudomonadota bacterium]